MTYTQLLSALTPAQIVALTLWGEARGQTIALRVAIACVIRNRSRALKMAPQFVCLAAKQFSCWNEDESENHAAVVAEANRLLADEAVGPVMRECLPLAAEVAAGVLVDTTGGARWYYAPAAMRPPGRVPVWAVGVVPTSAIDGTLFFTRTA